jgi:ABC-type molybdenum transport system ATPase subunit/photorepair protein PhrA
MLELRTLRAGEIGTGYLIEQDAGFISPTDERNTAFINEIKKLGSATQGSIIIVEPLTVVAVLQKYGIENRNGRIYPEAILRTQAEEYQKLVADRRALGELDHPECHRKTAEILTENGWVLLSDIDYDEKVYTLNPNTNQIELKPINKKIAKKYVGQLVHIKGRNIDLQVTPNHKFWVIGRNGVGKFITASEIHNRSVTDLNKMYIPKVGEWVGNSPTHFTINGLSDTEIAFNATHTKRDKLKTSLNIPMSSWVKFMGIYLADGCVVVNDTKKRVSKVLADGDVEYGFESSKSGYVCKITQKKEKSKKAIRALLSELPFNVKEVLYPDGKVDFKIHDARLHKYLKQFGKSSEKYIPVEILDLSPDLLTEFVDWFVLGDGRVRGKYNRVDMFSTSKRLIDDLHEVVVKMGKSGTIHVENRDYDRFFTNSDGTNRLIKKGQSKPLHFLNVSTTKGVYLDDRSIKTELVGYDDMVYCVDVPNHIFYVRDNGKACWNGNSSIISGKDISHNITKIWWEGATLMGELEILMSPGFINQGIISCQGDMVANLLRHNIKIGVSSRGVGSVEDVNGIQLVQNDFELICWDVVTNPSTPGSWIFKNNKEAGAFKESVEPKTMINLSSGLDSYLLG